MANESRMTRKSAGNSDVSLLPLGGMVILAAVAVLLAPAEIARGERIKDIVNIQGVRGNPLWGYGLVVGLNGTGDNSEASRRALANLLRRGNIVLNPSDVASKNIASVLVTAELGPFARKGSSLDVTVSAIGNAGSLQNGMLIMTELVGADGQTYAVAQGKIVIGGFSASGESASVTKNHTTVGRIANGAAVEREELAEFVEDGQIKLQLLNADFDTASNMAAAINKVFDKSSVADDAGAVTISVPRDLGKADMTKFIATIGGLDVKVDYPATIVINERTGTVIVGENVRISVVAISRGNLTIAKAEQKFVEQPPPFAPPSAKTETVNRTSLSTEEENGPMQIVKPQMNVGELVDALNRLGMTPRDMIPIFEDLKAAGALQGTVKVQ